MHKDEYGLRPFGVQLPRNLLFNVANFSVGILIGFWLTPFFVHTLGIAAYGLIPLAVSITSYVGLITVSLAQSVARFLTIQIQKRDFEKANRTFNTGLFGTTGLIVCLLPFLLFMVLNVPRIFDVPEGSTYDSVLLFLGILGAFLVSTWSATFTTPMFTQNRLDLYNIILIVERVSQVILILTLFALFSPNIRFVGAAFFIASLIVSILLFISCRRLLPELRINIRNFDRGNLRELGSMSAWMMVTEVGMLLFLQSHLILVNLLYGSIASAEYAIALQWSGVLYSLVIVLASVIGPMVVIYYAHEKFDAIISLSQTSIKMLGLGIALPISLLCGFAPELLSLWIGPEFAQLSPLLWILTIHLAFNLSTTPLQRITFSYNRMRIPGLITIGLGLGNLVLAVLLSSTFGLGIYGIATASAIMFTMRNAVFMPLYTARVVRVPVSTFLRPMLPSLLSLTLLVALTTGIGHVSAITTWTSLIVYSAIIGVCYLAVVWIRGLNTSEKRLLLSMLPGGVRTG